jgi:hypothetical protein
MCKAIHSEAREIIRHVIREWDEDAHDGKTKIDVMKRNLRVSNYIRELVNGLYQEFEECHEAGGSSLQVH